MKNAFQTRILAIGLALATLAVCVLAALNLQQENSFDSPTDGVWWVESQGGLQADRVPADSPAGRAGIHTGDILEAVNEHPTPRLASFERAIFRSGIWARASYAVLRPTALTQDIHTAPKLDISVILEPVDKTNFQIYRFIALVYLCIGLYVLFRRWTAPKSTHFFVFCLVSFVLYAFKYTTRLDTLDWVIYWSNIVATALQPALFLHFAVSFSDDFIHRKRNIIGRRVLVAFIYLPGLILIGIQTAAINLWSATEVLKHRLDQTAYAYLALYYVLAAVVFLFRYRSADSPLERQQLKWLTRGTLLAVVPFTVLYVLPYVFDMAVPALITKFAGLSLVFLPLTFSWAIVRYRLMDVDLIFKRGVTYTLATAALVGLYFGAVAISAEMVHTRLPSLKVYGLLAAIVVTGLVFDPLKRAIQGRVDRVFDQKRFDYRETLVDFGRSLNSQTDLSTLLASIVDRLPKTLLVTRVAVFLAEDDARGHSPTFALAASHGITDLSADPQALDVRFLDFDGPNANNHIFLENPQQVLRLPEDQRRTAGHLDLNYYLPCRVANREGSGTRTVAIIGLGRTHDGDFLSSEDMELLESLAGYIGIAIQNAQLYQRLESKITEFERLKEFHENIVESINIGVFAVDLEDRIESWNTPMEEMFAKPRREALRHPLASIFPPDFIEKYASVRDTHGVHGTHTLYKFRLALPNGDFRIANIAIAPLVTRDLIAIGRIVLVDDITDRIQLEGQLTQAEKLSSIGLLAAGVAHEVNTPLAVISSYTQMLSKHMRDDAKVAPILEKITQQTFRASEIVNGLLNFSRTSGSAFTDLDLNLLLHDTVTLLEHQFKTAQIRVITSYDPDLGHIKGNQGKLQQVILNLMLNAKDAMHGIQNATLRISTEHHADRIVAIIQDSGNGIEKEHLHRIYDPFFTTKATPQEGQRKGTGLGLAVTYGIMQEHAGKIEVESEPGAGTTFRLDFPSASPIVAPAEDSRTTIHA